MAAATMLPENSAVASANGGKTAVAEAAAASSPAAAESADSAAFALLDHDKRRKITLKCLELEEMLESQG